MPASSMNRPHPPPWRGSTGGGTTPPGAGPDPRTPDPRAPDPRAPARRATRQRSDTGVSVFAFPLGAVHLLAGPFLDNMNRTLAYLSFVDPDRLLHTFRLNAGIASSAQPVAVGRPPPRNCAGTAPGT